MKQVVTLLQGVALGIAEIIPGVSGSTIALLMGIYDDFIDLLYQGTELARIGALWLIRKKKWSDVLAQIKAIRWQFGILLGIGMVAAIASLASIITVLLVQYPAYVFAFLLGLTPPTMAIVYHQISKPTTRDYLITGATALTFLTVFMLNSQTTSVTNPHPVHLFLGGMVAVSTMVLPGVSGSFMLLVLGLYNFVLGLIAQVTSGTVTPQILTSLLILTAGMGTGFLTTVRVLKVAFESYKNQLMSFLLGLLVASWYVLWPFVAVDGFDHGEPILVKLSPQALPPGQSITIVIIAVVTAGLTWWLHHWADQQHPPTDHGIDRV